MCTSYSWLFTSALIFWDFHFSVVDFWSSLLKSGHVNVYLKYSGCLVAHAGSSLNSYFLALSICSPLLLKLLHFLHHIVCQLLNIQFAIWFYRKMIQTKVWQRSKTHLIYYWVGMCLNLLQKFKILIFHRNLIFEEITWSKVPCLWRQSLQIIPFAKWTAPK